MTRLVYAIAIAVLMASTGPALAATESTDGPQRWVPALEGSALPAGMQLSTALANYGTKQGWNVEWKLSEDYALDDKLQLPGINVVADVQWVLKTFQRRGVMADVGIEVNSEIKRVAILRKASLATDRDPVVEMRMSSLSYDSTLPTTGHQAPARPALPLAPLPATQSASLFNPSASRLVPIKPAEKDPNNPGLRLAPMPGMPFAPARDVHADAALVAAREAERKLAMRSAAQWDRVLQVATLPAAQPDRVLQVATPQPQVVDMAALLPPPSMVADLPSATASIQSAPLPTSLPMGSTALSLGSQVSLPHDAAPKQNASVAAKAVVAESPAEDEKVWVATNGTSLRTAVEEWAQQAGWVIRWDARIDYGVIGNLKFKGSFLDAIDKLFSAYGATARPLRADAYARQNLILVQE